MYRTKAPRGQFLTVLLLAGLLAAPRAMAETPYAPDDQPVAGENSPDDNPANSGDRAARELEKGLNDVTKALAKEARQAGEALTAAARSLEPAAGSGDLNLRPAPTFLDNRMTATGMLGLPVYDQNSTRVADIEDVILDPGGHAWLLIVRKGGFLGLGGKLTALNYDAVVANGPEGDSIIPLPREALSAAAEFTYQPTDRPNVRVMPPEGYSLRKILAGRIVDPGGEPLAKIENVSLADGRARLVIADYDQLLDMGGERVALDFDATRPVKNKDGVNLRLGEAQTEKFRRFEATHR